MQEKGIEIGKREIDEVPLVEGTPRYTAQDLDAEDAPQLAGSGDKS